MFVEIIITATIVTAAAIILYQNIKNKAKGQCNCSSCTSKCPSYKK